MTKIRTNKCTLRVRKIIFRHACLFFFQPQRMRNNFQKATSHIFDNKNIFFEIEGIENLAPNKSYIFAANHPPQSSLYKCFGYKPHYYMFFFEHIINKYLKNEAHSITRYPKIRLLSFILKKNKYIVLPHKKNDAKMKQKLNRSVAKYISQGDSILIFPEGCEQFGNTLHPFQKGLYHLSMYTKTPIIPVHMKGFNEPFTMVKFIFGAPEMPNKNQSAGEYVSSLRERVFRDQFKMELIE